jgi:glycosyltransferase involved in cell wall biosynthesis
MSTHFREIGGSTVAVLIPCFNEAKTVGSVIADMHRLLPAATVYVYDNNSTDDTAELAAAAGATVRSVPVQGKGNVVRRMFADIEADVYVLIDGDDTYDAAPLREMVDLVTQEGCDLVNGRRIATADMYTHSSHQLGNRVLSRLVHWLFGRSDLDMLSGLKVLSRRFVKSFPLFASGFELETEITVHALDLVMPIKSVPVGYRLRPQGSESKLRTYRDGTRILKTILALVRRERPLAFFGFIAALLLILAIVLGVPIVTEYAHTHKVPRFPTAFVVVGLLVVSVLVAFSGLILDTVTRGRKEAKMLRYLSLEGPLETSRQQQNESKGPNRPGVVADSSTFDLQQRRAT